MRHGYERIYEVSFDRVVPAYENFFLEGPPFVLDPLSDVSAAVYHAVMEPLRVEIEERHNDAGSAWLKIRQAQADAATDLAIIRDRVHASRLDLHSPMEEEVQGPIDRFMLGLPMDTQRQINAAHNEARDVVDAIGALLEDAIEDEALLEDAIEDETLMGMASR